jgi:uncharacterized membrane protein
MTRTMFATAVGIALGFALIFDGFGSMIIVALFGAIAFVIAKIAVGDIDVARYVQDRRSNP